MATGAIAFDRLVARDPAAVTAIDTLMAAHPDRARFDVALAGSDGVVRQRLLFERMARWPDDIRGTRYNHTHWHHELRVITGWKAFGAIRLGEADHAFAHALAIVRDADADPGERAIALCWLFHIVGDMHQPLHAGHRMDGRFPLTDRAGTQGWVRRAPDAPPETLHHFWDTAADRPGSEAAGADAIAREAEADLPMGPWIRGDAIGRYRGWVRESEQLAATVAYRDAALAESHRARDAPILSPDYVATARTVAEQRLGQAGARLAMLLAESFPGS
jgi:hypothetical protein